MNKIDEWKKRRKMENNLSSCQGCVYARVLCLEKYRPSSTIMCASSSSSSHITRSCRIYMVALHWLSHRWRKKREKIFVLIDCENLQSYHQNTLCVFVTHITTQANVFFQLLLLFAVVVFTSNFPSLVCETCAKFSFLSHSFGHSIHDCLTPSVFHTYFNRLNVRVLF